MNDLQKQPKSVLGRGLDSLLKSSEHPVSVLPIDKISPSQSQPRKFFSEIELNELAESIKHRGVLQPILVRLCKEDSMDYDIEYEIIAGERRWRASKLAQLTEIPVIVRDFTNDEALEVALVENTQRLDLNPIEEADGYNRLMLEYGHTQEELSKIMGKSRSHIANTLRLLSLPETIRIALQEGRLSAGHGRTLIGAEDPETLAAQIMEGKLSVREAERLSKNALKQRNEGESEMHHDPEEETVRNLLTDFLGAPTELIFRGRGGKIIIPFKTLTELDGLLEKFSKLKPRVPHLKAWTV